jgi:hypothetical protein
MFNDFGRPFGILIILIGIFLVALTIALTFALAKGADVAWRRFRRKK